jgi:hypothetical protein
MDCVTSLDAATSACEVIAPIDENGIYVDGSQMGTQTPDQVKRWRDRDALSYTLRQLACGTGYMVGVDVIDSDDRHSPLTSTTVRPGPAGCFLVRRRA